MKKQALLNALEMVKPGLASRELIEQTTSFAFVKGRVITYNDEISISHPVEGLDIEGAVSAEEIYNLLKKIKKDDIEFNLDGNEIRINSGKTKAGLTLHSEIKLPLDEIGKVGKWKDLPKEFLKAVSMTIHSCAKSTSNPIVNCIHVNKSGFVESTDNYRATRYLLGEEMPIDTFLLPSNNARELIKLAPTKIAEGRNWVHFSTKEGTLISCRINNDKFPLIEPLLNVEGDPVQFPKSIWEKLDIATTFATKTTHEAINIILSKDKITMKSKNEVGWVEEESRIKYDGESISFTIAPELLRQILEQTKTGTFSKRFLKFENDNWKYIVAVNILSE